MLFNSLSFAFFLPIVFLLYWFVFGKTLKLQNIFLLVASYYFYSCWDWRFLFLLAFSTFLDYYSGIAIYRCKAVHKKRIWLFISVGINLGFLCIFKYYNFFAITFAELIKNIGFNVNIWTLRVILPIGISFYTFHGLSYVFDIYNGKIKPTTNWINYSLFVSFFPLLVAGPIERATHLLPQIEKPRTFNRTKAVDGLRQILWGLFKKIVIADSCADYVNLIFTNANEHSGSTMLLGSVLFAFQIYGDFSGYSDIALGVARLMGFELLKNFNFPYFSRDIAEFWRRWHISLSSWFKDYLYFPLGGSKKGLSITIRNTIIIFLVSGFWHGANWTFIVWGGLNALFIIPSILFKTNRNNLDIVAKGRLFPKGKEVLQIFSTFALTVFAWIFFRSDSLRQAISCLKNIFSFSLFSIPQYFLETSKILVLLIFPFVIIEWLGRENNYALEKFAFGWPKILRIAFYSLVFLMCVGSYKISQEFIYFQF